MTMRHACGYSVTPLYDNNEVTGWQCNYCGKIIPAQPTRAELRAALRELVEASDGEDTARYALALKQARRILGVEEKEG